MAKRPAQFSFGQNWQKYLEDMPAIAIERTIEYVQDWLGDVSGLAFLDIGSGSGLTALAALTEPSVIGDEW